VRSGGRSGTAPTRRTLLTGAALLAGTAIAAVASGCTGSSPAGSGSNARPRPPSPDESAAGRAVLTTRSLLAAEAELADLPWAGPLIVTIAASHRAHLAALGMADPKASPSGSESLLTSPAESASPAGWPSVSPTSWPWVSSTGSPARPTPGTAPASPGSGAAAAAVSRELAAAAEALADVLPTTPATAGLLARIAAARTVHADRLAAAAGLPAPTGPSAPGEPVAVSTAAAASTDSPTAAVGSPDTSSTSPVSPTGGPLDDGSAAALAALLAGEHAAVFAYGLITARAVPARAASARAFWAAHRARRDELERRLIAADRTPVASLPAYDVGRLPTTPAQLAALAATVENGLAAVALGAVTGSKGAIRSEAGTDLVRAARRAAAWRGLIDPLPGAPS
jgi:hypothetical protein